jgi:hypothetical protein
VGWPGYEKYLPPGVISPDTGRVSRQTATAAKGSKYRNVKTTVDGITFHSAREANRWSELKMLQAAGEIYGLNRQVPFELVVNGMHITRYVADFCYFRTDRSLQIVEDSKGCKTEAYLTKRKLMKACLGIEILET